MKLIHYILATAILLFSSKAAFGEAGPTLEQQKAILEQYLNEGKEDRDAQLKKLEQKRTRPAETASTTPVKTESNDPSQYLGYNRRYGIRRPAAETEEPRRPEARTPNLGFVPPAQAPAQPQAVAPLGFSPQVSEFASAFQPKSEPNATRQALLRVKRFAAESEAEATRQEEETKEGAPFENIARLSILGGTSSIASNSSLPGNFLPNLYLGFQGDVKLNGFLGVEADGFYGLSSSLQEITVTSSGQETGRTNYSTQNDGIMGNFRLSLPLPINGIWVIPRVGFGYGWLGIRSTAEVQGQADWAAQNAQGPYFVVGVEVMASQNISLAADYAGSISSSGSYSPSIGLRQDLLSAGFRRIRLEGRVRVYGNFFLGAQYAQRVLTSGAATADVPTFLGLKDNTLTQFLGFISYQF